MFTAWRLLSVPSEGEKKLTVLVTYSCEVKGALLKWGYVHISLSPVAGSGQGHLFVARGSRRRVLTRFVQPYLKTKGDYI